MGLDKACRTHGTFRVRWRSGRRWRPSFRFPEGNKMVVERLNRRHARVKLPKLGWVKFRLSRSLDDMVLRSATLTRDGTHWFVSFLVDDGHDTPAGHAVPGTAVGVDRGVVVAIATSDGELLDRRLLTPGEQDRMARLQRQLSRCGRRGSNRDRIRAALAEIRGRERRRRQDFCAQSAHYLASANAVVVLQRCAQHPGRRACGRRL
jgi:putative transposase